MDTITLDKALKDNLEKLTSTQSTTIGKSTIEVLRHLGGVNLACLNEEDRFVLEVLNRKISVTHHLWKTYDEDWNQPLERQAVPQTAWLVLCIILFTTARENLKIAHLLGQGLKLINGALTALDGAGDLQESETGLAIKCAIDNALNEALDLA
jgi:hypothetical protein